MKTITTRKDGSKLFVEVSKDDANYTFPTGTSTRESDTGKVFYQIPVKYVEVEPADVVFTDALIAAYRALGLNVDDMISAANAGLRLAVGDLAKAPFRKEGGKKLAATAMDWLVNDADPSLFSDYRALPAATDADKSARRDWLLEAYRTR